MLSSDQEQKLFEHYSERAQRVIFLTRRKAGQSGAAALDTGHLIEALVLEDQGKLADALGVPPEAIGRLATSASEPNVQFFPPETASGILARLEQILPHGKAIPDSIDMPISSALGHVFDAAMTLRAELHHKQIEPLHLLAAAVSEQLAAAKLLATFGVTRDHVIRTLKDGLQRP
jgi:ATP-dependent Clp protease ATP-binding subunit ClpA